MSFAQRADVAYAVYTPEQRHPVEVAASEEEHLISWLSKRLNRPLSVPSLQEYGYSLVGGRLLPGEAGPAAQFMYENPERRAAHALRDGHSATTKPRFACSATATAAPSTGSTTTWATRCPGRSAEGKLRSIAIDVCSALGGKPEAWQ